MQLLCAALAVICVIVGTILFLTSKKKDGGGKSKAGIVPDDYEENFKTAYEQTGTIEGALAQLADIYEKNKAFGPLVADAYDAVEAGGDYESALASLNRDNSEEIAKMHSDAISKALAPRADKGEAKEEESEEEDYIDEDGEGSGLKI